MRPPSRPYPVVPLQLQLRPHIRRRTRNAPVQSLPVLAVHLLWTDDGGGGFLLWGEDSDLPQSGPPRRGRNPTVPVPQPHPFTAAGSRLIEGVLDVAPTLHAAVANGSPEESRVVWLPGKPHAPLASPELIRTDAATGSSRRAPGLWPFEVTALRVSPSAGLDVALALGAAGSPDVHAGASVSTFAVLAALALEIAAAGRVLPDLRHGGRGVRGGLGAPAERGGRPARPGRGRLAPPGLPCPHRRGGPPRRRSSITP